MTSYTKARPMQRGSAPLKREDDEDPGSAKGYWARGEFNIHLPGHELHQYEITDELVVEKAKNDPTMQLCKDQDYKVFAGAELKRKAVFSPKKTKSNTTNMGLAL